MSIEMSGSGVMPEPIKQESSAPSSDLEQTMREVRDTIRAESVQRNLQATEANELSAEDIAEAAEEFASLAQSLNRDLRFNVTNDLEQPIIRVVDRTSGEMIRQIPTEEFVDLAVKLRELRASDGEYDSATGLLIDSRV